MFLLATGCGGDDGASIDAASIDVAIADAVPVDAAVCGTVVNQGAALQVMQIAQGAPTPQGGTITDGTYTVTASVIYTGVGGGTGPNGSMIEATSMNTAGAYQFIDEGGGSPNRSSGAFATNGTSITITQTCPDPTALGFTGFDATATVFTIYDPTNPSSVAAITFTKV